MSWLDKWSNQEIAYVVSASARHVSWDRMARNFNRKFDTTVSGNTLKKLYRLLTESNVDYPQEEIDFIHKCHLNLMSEKQTIMAYGEVFGKPLNIKRWENLLKKTPSKEIQEVIKSQKENKNKEVKNMKNKRKGKHGGVVIPYTYEETKMIVACDSRAEAIKLSSVLGRSEAGIGRKWWELNKDTSKVKRVKKEKTKGGYAKPYSVKEEKMLKSCENAKEARKLSKKLNRSPQAVTRKWYVLRSEGVLKDMQTIDAKLLKAGLSDNNGYSKKQRELLGLRHWPPKRFDMESKIGDKITKKDAEKFVALKNAHIKNMGTRKKRSESKYLDVEKVNQSIVYEPTMITWTEEQDFDILCNFYELSIDEAREKFNKSYAEIAGRLEYLIDSTEPQHHSMLIEASKVIKERKAKSAKPSKPSRRERRIARKQARLQKRIDKIKKQLRRD